VQTQKQYQQVCDMLAAVEAEAARLTSANASSTSAAATQQSLLARYAGQVEHERTEKEALRSKLAQAAATIDAQTNNLQHLQKQVGLLQKQVQQAQHAQQQQQQQQQQLQQAIFHSPQPQSSHYLQQPPQLSAPHSAPPQQQPQQQLQSHQQLQPQQPLRPIPSTPSAVPSAPPSSVLSTPVLTSLLPLPSSSSLMYLPLPPSSQQQQQQQHQQSPALLPLPTPSKSPSLYSAAGGLSPHSSPSMGQARYSSLTNGANMGGSNVPSASGKQQPLTRTPFLGPALRVPLGQTSAQQPQQSQQPSPAKSLHSQPSSQQLPPQSTPKSSAKPSVFAPMHPAASNHTLLDPRRKLDWREAEEPSLLPPPHQAYSQQQQQQQQQQLQLHQAPLQRSHSPSLVQENEAAAGPLSEHDLHMLLSDIILSEPDFQQHSAPA